LNAAQTAAGGYSAVHVQRIKAAAKKDAARKRRRDATHAL